MKKLFYLLILTFSCNMGFSQILALEWVKGIGGSSSDKGNSIKLDLLGNVYTIGQFKDTVDFDPGVSQFNLVSNGYDDVFVQKLDAGGSFIWAKSFGGDLMDMGFSIDVDLLGNVYLTGLFQDTVDFDPGIGNYSLSSNGYYDCFILKLNSSGNLIWAKSLGSADSDFGNAISIDNDKNLYVSGSFSGSVDFDTGIATYIETSSGLDDIFILKLDSSGNFIWVNTFGTGTTDGGAGFAIDQSNNIYTTGRYNNQYIYVNKIDSGGNNQWMKQFGGVSLLNDSGVDIEVDDSGNLYIVGNFGSTADFDPGIGVFNLSSNGTRDIFIEKLDANGNFIWAKSMGGDSFDYGTSVALDAESNVYISGSFLDTVDFDPGSGINYLITPPGYQQAFVQKLDSAGNLMWVRSLEGTMSQTDGSSILVDNSNSLYLTGSFYNTTDFDPENSVVNLSAVGSSDIFILKWNQNTAVGIESLNWNKPFYIYPNPVHSTLNIGLEIPTLNSFIQFKLLDLTGKEVMNKKITSNYTSIDIQILAKGLYVYQFINEDDKTILSFGKMVVQ